MRYLLMAGLVIGGAAVLYALRDTPMVRQRTRRMRCTASGTGGGVAHAAADGRDAVAHAIRGQQAA